MQILNFAGIAGALRAISKPQLLIPRLQARDLADIDWRRLRLDHGIRAVALDKDNCLTLPYADSVYPPVAPGLAACIQEFSAAAVAVLSNSAGSSDDTEFREAQRLEQLLQVPVLRHGSKKPAVKKALLNHFAGVAAHEIALVGDRVLTDVLMGNEMGCFTILTQAFTTKGDAAITTLVRRLELEILHWVQRRSRTS